MTTNLQCYGIFGSFDIAYFAKDDNVGLTPKDWTSEHVAAMREFAANHPDTFVSVWVEKMVTKWRQCKN